ncbi:hypothetical protein [Roseovarius ramblicola]|uniref:Phage integrase family protein n=1 Tax=Roseovarius ramblicola TaxID=2022336 RepID=A0ABV5HX24_9RHOB
MPFNPFLASSGPASALKVETMEHVLTWVNELCDREETTKKSYRDAVIWSGKHIRKPLSKIKADRNAVLAHFADHEYSKEWAKTFEAFRRRKRNLSAAINGATGVIAARADRNGRTDSWRRLIARLTHLLNTQPNNNSALHEKKIVGVQVLANLARSLEIESFELRGSALGLLYKAASSTGQRDAVIKTFAFLNETRKLGDAEVLACLPKEPISFVRPTGSARLQIPAALSEELEIWITIATRGPWSPTDKCFGDGVDRGPYTNAVRKVVSTAITISLFLETNRSTVAFAFADDILTEVVRTWRVWEIQADLRAIKAGTANGYLEYVETFLKRNGEAADHVRNILKTDKWLKSSRTSDTKMAPAAQRFCRRVVRDMEARANFLALHVKYRNKAEKHLQKAKTCRLRRKHHLEKARKYGTIAAFAALETDAAPIRIGSALRCTISGPSPWLNLGVNKSSNGRLFVPAGKSKNKQAIRAPISTKSRTRGIETLRWYEKKIRPLFPHHDENDFFFPAVKSMSKFLPYTTLKKWWDQTIAEFGFPGMNPHMFRHGQASILIANNPGNWAHVMARLGDTLETCMDYYGWMDEERLIEEGQNLLTKDLPNV